MVVQAVVDEIKLQLEQQIRQAIMGAINRRQHTSSTQRNNIDWKWNDRRNLKKLSARSWDDCPRASVLLLASRTHQ